MVEKGAVEGLQVLDEAIGALGSSNSCCSVHHEPQHMRHTLPSPALRFGPCCHTQALEEARAAVEAEQGRSMRLEVELAEARQALGRMEELERELQKYR